MYNLFRKSIILAGLGLLFFYSCTTVKIDTTEQEYKDVDIYNIFPVKKEYSVFINRYENSTFLNSFINKLEFPKVTQGILDKTDYIYLNLNNSIQNGFDTVLTGEYSYNKLEFGLFWSWDWKKVKIENDHYWISKDGLKLYISRDNYIIISLGDITKLISHLSFSNIKPSTHSFVLSIPELKEELLKKITNGFIKGNINSLDLYLDADGKYYNTEAKLYLEDSRKAKAFSRLMQIFIKIMLSTLKDADIIKIVNEIQIKMEDSSVYLTNMRVEDKLILDYILNNLNGETKE